MIDKDISLDTTRTSCLKPELINGINTGDLLTPEVIKDIETGDLLAAKEKIEIVTGDLLTPEQINGIVTGNLLTPEPLPVTSGFPLNYARIGYENLLIATTAVTGNPENVLTPSTYDKYRPTIGLKTVKYQMSVSALIDYVGIAAHNFGTHDDGIDITIKYATSVGGSLTTLGTITPTDNNSAVMFRFNAVTAIEVVLVFTTTTNGAEIGVLYSGKELEMMRPMYSGYSPATLSSKDVFTPQMSDGGQFLGKQLVRKGFATEANFRHLTYDWYEAEFQPFVIHAKTLPYFWAWNLEEHPDEIVYGWTNENIKPSLMGIRNWLEVSFNIDAHGDL